VAEESLHRGLIFGSLYVKSHMAAYILSTMIFAAVHVMGYVGIYSARDTALAFVQYIPAGLALAWAYRKSGSIFAPMLMHATINCVSLFALR
jgi:membrane protease YdiL (CAAX protease family)